MRTLLRSGKPIGLLAGLCVLACAGSFGGTASAQGAAPSVVANTQAQKPAASAQAAGLVANTQPQKPAASARAALKPARRGAEASAPAPKRYFVEFRARYALSYGHTFLAHGQLNEQGEIVQSEVAGLHPAGDSPVPWMIGHVLPVKSETGPSDGDLEDEYIAARYRVELREAEYKHALAYIRRLQASSPVWHAIFYNCNAFVGDVARHMGLRAPNVTLLYPQVYIDSLREMNTGTQASALVASDDLTTNR